MKLRNKKTGEMGIINYFDNQSIVIYPIDENWNAKGDKKCVVYHSLAQLNEEWQDYEEPKGTALYWMILTLENFIENEPDDKWVDLEDCKQMLKKLKAWKRLRDKGFRFIDHIDRDDGHGMTRYEWDGYINGEDLDLLFGGEE